MESSNKPVLDSDLLRLANQAFISGGIVDCTGANPTFRKVLGTMPITADGCVVMKNGWVYHHEIAFVDDQQLRPMSPWLSGTSQWCALVLGYDYRTHARPMSECYSTIEAALKAKEANGKA